MYKFVYAVEPQYNDGPSFCFIKVLFHIVYYYWGQEVVSYTEDFVIYRSSSTHGSTVSIIMLKHHVLQQLSCNVSLKVAELCY